MQRLPWSFAFLLAALPAAAAGPAPARLLTGLKGPAAVTAGPDGKVYVTVRGGVVRADGG